METFQIGQEVWYVHLESVEKWLPCPDCFGKKFLTVILGDGSEVTIDCEGCYAGGFEGPRGIVRVYQYSPQAQLGKVIGVECDRWNQCQTVEYRVRGAYDYHLKACDVFLDKEAAEARAIERAKEEGEAAMAAFHKREKPTHKWSWNVTYHRNQIKQANRDLQYHTAKLEVAKKLGRDEAIAMKRSAIGMRRNVQESP